VLQHAVDHLGAQRAGLDVVPFMGAGEFGSLNMQQRDMVDVDAVCTGFVALAVAGEFAPYDADLDPLRTAGQYAVLIVEKSAVLDRQIATFGPDAGTVSIHGARPLQGYVAHRDVAAIGDQDRLAGADLVGHDDSGSLAFNDDVVLADAGAIEIPTGINVDR